MYLTTRGTFLPLFKDGNKIQEAQIQLINLLSRRYSLMPTVITCSSY